MINPAITAARPSDTSRKCSPLVFPGYLSPIEPNKSESKLIEAVEKRVVRRTIFKPMILRIHKLQQE
jgi:hypothetical protein